MRSAPLAAQTMTEVLLTVAVAVVWRARAQVLAEFYYQGIKQSSHGLPIDPFFCDRANPAVAKAQTGFIGFVVKPLFEKCAREAARSPVRLVRWLLTDDQARVLQMVRVCAAA
jgi:hypothetical protein